MSTERGGERRAGEDGEGRREERKADEDGGGRRAERRAGEGEEENGRRIRLPG